MSETPDGDDDSVEAADAVDDGAVDDDAVSAADVRHVAELARVDLADEEVAEFADQFEEILDYFAALDEVPETDGDTELVNVMRADEVREGLSQEAALSNAPDSESGYFRGPRVS